METQSKLVKRIALVAMILFVLPFLQINAEAASAKLQVTASQIKIRKSASASSKALVSAKKGATLKKEGSSGSWYKVSYQGKTGYVKKSQVEVKDSDDDKAESIKITAKKAYLYKSSKTSSKKLSTLKKGKKVTLLKKVDDGKWLKVKVGGKTGYILSKNTELAKDIKSAENEYKTLKKGDKGEAVKKLQKRLKELGYFDGNVAGNYYSITAKAVKEFQKAADIKATGNANVATQKALFASDAPKKSDAKNEKNDKNEYKALKKGDKGEAVKKLQKRLKELGYFDGNVAGNYYSITAKAVKEFQKAADIKATGNANVATQKALFASNAPKKSDAKKGDATSDKKDSDKKSSKVKEADWWTSNIQQVFARGTTATITDVATGISWKEQRRGGTNHADVQPLTAADTAKMKQAYGGSWSWDRRAVWVTVGGQTYAASMNGMPHGGGSIQGNDFNGHHCIHFTNSRTHGGNRLDPAHQAAVKKALEAGK